MYVYTYVYNKSCKEFPYRIFLNNFNKFIGGSKMSFAKKHKKGAIDWGIDTKDFEYFKLADLYEMNGKDETYTLKGLFINRNKPEKQLKEFGASPVGILEDK